MSDTTIQGGFVGDPTAAPSTSTAGGCCGTALAEAATTAVAEPAATPCCGTAAEAESADACCGTAAKADAVSSGASCCG